MASVWMRVRWKLFSLGISPRAFMMRSFHGLASFYRQFIRNFNSIVAPMTEVIKGSSFQLNPKAQMAFEEVKIKLTQALVLT